MLITPTIDYEESYKRYIKELGDEERYPYPLDLDHRNFAHLVATLNNYAKGMDLPSHLVANTTFWLIENNEIVACSHLRHTLNEALAFAGGHIGIGVRPSMRKQGIGQKLLQLTIQQAVLLGINQVHIHCYKSNPSSIKLIESVGAKLDSTVALKNSEEEVLRFIYKA